MSPRVLASGPKPCGGNKTWVFDQSERAQGPIYVIILDNDWQKDNEKFCSPMISCKAVTKILYGNSKKGFKKHLPAIFLRLVQFQLFEKLTRANFKFQIEREKPYDYLYKFSASLYLVIRPPSPPGPGYYDPVNLTQWRKDQFARQTRNMAAHRDFVALKVL